MGKHKHYGLSPREEIAHAAKIGERYRRARPANQPLTPPAAKTGKRRRKDKWKDFSLLPSCQRCGRPDELRCCYADYWLCPGCHKFHTALIAKQQRIEAAV